MLINSSSTALITINGFNINISNSSNIICKLFLYTSYSFSLYYPIVLICASVDRLLVSSQNVDMRLYSSRRLGYFSVSISAFVCATFSSHTLIKGGIQELYPSYFICYYDLSAAYLNFVSYSLLLMNTILFLLMLGLSVLTFKNVRHIRPVRRQQHQQIRPMTKKDFQLLRSLYVHDISYITFTLLLVGSIIFDTIFIYRTPTQFEQALQPILAGIGGLVHDIPYCTSFFIFIGVSKAFRQEVKRSIYKILGKDGRTIHDAENDHAEIPNPLPEIQLF